MTGQVPSVNIRKVYVRTTKRSLLCRGVDVMLRGRWRRGRRKLMCRCYMYKVFHVQPSVLWVC